MSCRTLVVVCSLATLAGCSTFADRGRESALLRAHEILDCPRLSITTRYVGGGGFVAEGCGQRQSFTCVHAPASGEVVCSPDGRPEVVRPEEPGWPGRAEAPTLPAATSSRATDDTRVARDALLRCTIPDTISIAVTIAPDGHVVRTETPGLDVDAGACVVTELRATAFSTRDREEIAVVVLTAHAADRSAARSAPPSTPPSSPAATDRAAETEARAIIDGLRDAILACTGGSAAAVVADWSADGSLVLHLPEARTGSAEDGCVRALGRGATLPSARGSAGSVLHAVH